jgi:hypothetical protein
MSVRAKNRKRPPGRPASSGMRVLARCRDLNRLDRRFAVVRDYLARRGEMIARRCTRRRDPAHPLTCNRDCIPAEHFDVLDDLAFVAELVDLAKRRALKDGLILADGELAAVLRKNGLATYMRTKGRLRAELRELDAAKGGPADYCDACGIGLHSVKELARHREVCPAGNGHADAPERPQSAVDDAAHAETPAADAEAPEAPGSGDYRRAGEAQDGGQDGRARRAAGRRLERRGGRGRGRGRRRRRMKLDKQLQLPGYTDPYQIDASVRARAIDRDKPCPNCKDDVFYEGAYVRALFFCSCSAQSHTAELCTDCQHIFTTDARHRLHPRTVTALKQAVRDAKTSNAH